MAEELYQKQRERARSRSVRRAKSIADSKKRELTPLEKHNLLTATVAKLGHDMSVFHLRWVPGDYLDEDILNSVPMFWFKKFGWRPEDIKVLYAVGHMKMNQSMLTEMQKVYGKKTKGKNKNKSKKNILQNHILLKDQNTPSSPTVNDSEEAVYMRTKRLKKQNVSQKNVLQNTSRKNSRSASISKSESRDNQPFPLGLKAQGSVEMGPNLTLGNIDSTNSNNGSSGDRERADTSELRLPRATHSFSHHHRRQSSMSSRRPSLVESGELIWSRLAATRGDTLNRRQFDIELQNNNILCDPDVSAEIFNLLRNNKKDQKTVSKDDFLRLYPQLDSIPLKDEIEDPQSLAQHEKIMIVLKQVLYHVMSQTPFDVNDYLTPKLKLKDLNDPKKIIHQLGSRESDWRIRLQIMEWITANMEEDSHQQLNELSQSENLGPFLLGWMTQCLDERSNLSKAALYMFPEVFGMIITQNLEAFGYLNDIMKSLFLVLRNKRSEQLATIADQTAIEIIEMIMEWHQNHQLDDEILLEICEIFRDNTSMKEQKHGKVRERCCAYFGYILYGLDIDTINRLNTAAEKSNKKNKNNKNGNDSVVSPASPLDLSVINEIPVASKLNVNDKTKSNSKPKGKGKQKNNNNNDNNNNNNNNNNSDDKKSESKEDEKENESKNDNDSNKRKVTIKISKQMRRSYLLENTQFTEYMAASLEKATADKEEHVRNVAFRLMDKVSKTDEKILHSLFKSDPYTMKRFDKYKSRKMAKKGKSPRNARRGTVSAVRQAREKAMLMKRKSTPHHGKAQGTANGAVSMPVTATIVNGSTVDKNMD